jgi:ABC-type lipoprotein export system ATPase subunit
MIAALQNVYKQYDQPGSGAIQVVLENLSLTIEKHDSIAIIGPSGSGKSTLLNILGTLDTPSSGKVLLNNIPVDTLDEKRLAGIRNRFIGFVFQLHYLLPQLTLMENVLLPVLPVRDADYRRNAEQRARQLIDRVGLNDQIQQRPHQMSVGECQRAALVRALINNPSLLLADEPTGSLDSENAARLGELLKDLHMETGLAMVVVTHSMEIARGMKKIYRLTSGVLQQMTQP